MKSLRVVFLIVVSFTLLMQSYGMEAVQTAGMEVVQTARETAGVSGSNQMVLKALDAELYGDYYGPGVGGGNVLVIPTISTDEAAATALVTSATRDLSIMCRIFDKELGLANDNPTFVERYLGDGYRRNLVYELALGPRARGSSCMYLQGHAAVFLLNVDFPLTPGSKEPSAKSEPNEPADMVWRQATQELYGPRDSSKKEKDSTKEYDATKVMGFKANLLKTFKHAANIKCLRSDDSVIAVVWGPGSGSGQPKKLVFRASMADVTDLAEGTLTLEEFRDQVQILTVPGGPRPWSPGSGLSIR